MNNPQFVYLEDEKSLSEKTKQTIGVPLRLFDLKGLYIDQEKFLREIAPTFSMLAWDFYDVKRAQVEFLKSRYYYERHRLDIFLGDYYMKRVTLEAVGDLIADLSETDRHVFNRVVPRRKRSIAKFDLNCVDDKWQIERLKCESFVQNVTASDPRSLKRIFNETSELVTAKPCFKQLIGSIADMAAMAEREYKQRDAQKIKMTFHQVSLLADIINEGRGAPEGIHQDGADYIVSALVIERIGIIGGESVIYFPDRETELWRHTLLPGQGIFQADQGTCLWHDVTPIRDDPTTPPPDGNRNTFGFDINVIE